MKILLTTIVDNTNIGTYLQALATTRTLERLGHSVTVLNYLRKYIVGPEYAWKRWKNKNILFRIAYTIAYVRIVKKNLNIVRRFLLDRVSMTPQVDTLKGVEKQSKGYDLYLTGSDQVWNCGHNQGFDPVFCNGFIQGNKASYAASIGMEHIPTEYTDVFKHYLSQYKYISVRESSAVNALNEIGITNAREVLDPTLLLNKDEWAANLTRSVYNGEKYLLVYSVEEDKENKVYELAKKVAEIQNLKIFYLTSCSGKNATKYDKVINNASPEDFLFYFLNASFAVVSSFHGTAFSVNFNIPFYTVLPNKYNTRVVSLLKHYGIEERIIDGFPKDNDVLMDFAGVNSILESDRQNSVDYLKLITK